MNVFQHARYVARSRKPGRTVAPSESSPDRSPAVSAALLAKYSRKFILGALFLLFATTSAAAQGVLLTETADFPMPLPRPFPTPRPAPTSTYKIEELLIQTDIDQQIARTQVSQTFVNTGPSVLEVSFVFPLPYDGAIDRLTFLVGNREYDAKLLPADEARRIYEGYIRRNQDPALLEWLGQGMFKTSVFPIPAGEKRTVTLRYSQVLRKNFQLTDYLFPLSTAKYSSRPIERIRFAATIEADAKIKSVYSPSHEIDIERQGPHRAKVAFSAEDAIPVSDFRLFFDTSDDAVGASLLSYWPEGDDQGYFMLLASPEIRRSTVQVPRKAVVLVADRSGSMSGKKITQAKEALKFVINNLNPGDAFNIIGYDSEVETFRPELQKFNDETRQAALHFVEDQFANGSTNISAALSTALEMLEQRELPSYVVFFTDGLPTAGITDEMQIVQKTEQLNRNQTRLINLGVGYDVNSRLLDRLSRAHRGQSIFVRPNDDLEAFVSRVYQKISAPVMTSLELDVDLTSAADVTGSLLNRTYPAPLPDLFQGEQLTLAGRYRHSGDVEIKLSGRVGEKRETLEFAGELNPQGNAANFAFIEKIWAQRRIGEIIDELDLNGKNEELVQELIDLSTRHGIITPYTSFLADDQPGRIEAAASAPAQRDALERLSLLDRTSGRSGFEQRAAKNQLQEAARPTAAAFSTAPRGSSNQGGFGGGGVEIQNAETGEKKQTGSVQVIGNQALYRRGDLWIAANARGVDPVADADQIETVPRFSERYFELVRQNSAAENAILAQQPSNADLLIRLRNKLYRFE